MNIPKYETAIKKVNDKYYIGIGTDNMFYAQKEFLTVEEAKAHIPMFKIKENMDEYISETILNGKLNFLFLVIKEKTINI